MWNDQNGAGLGGTEYSGTVSKYWGNVSYGAGVVSSYSWAIGTSALVLLLPVQIAVEFELGAQQTEVAAMAAQGGAPAPAAAAPASA